jgi:DNA-binding response OmpR family regulator
MKKQLIRRKLKHQPMHHSETPSINASEVAKRGADTAIRFRRFRLLPRSRQLFVDGLPADLGSRAFDLLMVLIRAPGRLVTKSEILARVWPNTVVEESNLQVQVSALRKALSRDRDIIKTIPRRGYMFAVEDTASSVESDGLIPRAPESAPPPLAPARSCDLSASRLRPRVAQRTILGAEARPTVVVIDDDENVREALGGLLRSVGLSAELFGSVQEFLDSAHPDRPGCLVLDVRLPGRSGLDFYDDLVKTNMHLPVIFISGSADVPMSVRAMKAGAMEFLTKPVRNQDLLDAIQLAIEYDPARRSEQQVGGRSRATLVTPLQQSAGLRETTLRVGPLELDLLDRTTKRGDRSIQLLPREFQLLEYMMRRRDRILSRAILLKEIWNYKFAPETNIVDVHMGRLRHKVDEPNEAPMIQNVRGIGFILSAPAESCSLDQVLVRCDDRGNGDHAAP